MEGIVILCDRWYLRAFYFVYYFLTKTSEHVPNLDRVVFDP